jgi:hypothetical protein
MELARMKQLAGITESKDELDTNIMLNEAVVIPLDATSDQLAGMFDAARRAMGLINRLKNPIDRKKHLSAVFSNLNKIRAALSRMIAAEDEKIAKITPPTMRDQGTTQRSSYSPERENRVYH